MEFIVTPQVVANIALQVNPAINLRLSDRNTIVEVEGLDEQGRTLLKGLNIEGKEVQEALRIIAKALHEADFLMDERRIIVALNPVGDRLGEAELQALTGTMEEALYGYSQEHDLHVKVTSAVLTVELADAIQNLNLKPADYVDLVYKAGSVVATQVLNLRYQLGVDPTLFKDEFGTIVSSLIDMTEAGMTNENALAIFRSSLAADSTLEELTTITAASIDLHEAGASQDAIIAVFKLIEEQLAAGLDRNLLLEEFSTIAAAKIDMLDAGIAADYALLVLRKALIADPTLEELTTITAAFIDLAEEGLSKQDALLRIQEAIKVDPTFENFDDLLEDPAKENKVDDEIIEQEPKSEDVESEPQVDEAKEKVVVVDVKDAPEPDKPEIDETKEDTNAVENVESTPPTVEQPQVDEAKEEGDEQTNIGDSNPDTN
jgi:hypothetical protein